MKSFLLLFFFIPLFVQAQTTHTVAPKESLYSLGRQYGISPKEIAAYNNISIETGLTIGQVIKIPANAKNQPAVKTVTEKKSIPVTQNEKPGITGSPIYHKVEEKEHYTTLVNCTKMLR